MGGALRSSSSAAKKAMSSLRDCWRSSGSWQSELEHAAHPGRELIGHRLVDAEHLSDDSRRGSAARSRSPRRRVPVVDEAVDERAAERHACTARTSRPTCGEKAGRISRRAQRCSGGSLLIGGAVIPLGRACRRRSHAGDTVISRDEKSLDVVRDREDVVVSGGQPRAAPALGVRDRAAIAELVPDAAPDRAT